MSAGSRIEADDERLAALMATVVDDDDLYLEHRAVCADGYRVGEDEETEHEHQGRGQQWAYQSSV